MPTACAHCGAKFKEGEKRFKLGEETLCAKCIDTEATKGNVCPCCKTHIPGDTEEVGLLLATPGASMLKKARSVEVLAIVCPNCHVMFFNEFTYKTLQTLKK